MVISPPPKKKVILALLRPGMFYGRFGDPRLWGQHLKLLLSGVWIWISSVTMWWRCLSSTINIYLGLIQTHLWWYSEWFMCGFTTWICFKENFIEKKTVLPNRRLEECCLSQNWQFSGPWWFQHIQNHPPRQKPTNPTRGWFLVGNHEQTKSAKVLTNHRNHLDKSSLFYHWYDTIWCNLISYEYVCKTWISWIQDSSNAPNISQHGVSK